MLIRNYTVDVFMSNKPIPVMSFAVVTLAGFIGLVTVDKCSSKFLNDSRLHETVLSFGYGA